MNPKWKQVRLDELTEADSPITYGVVKPGDPGDVLFIRGGDLAGGRVLNNQLRTITNEISKQYSRTLLRGGELLICLVGQPGQVAVAPHALVGANIARQVGLIRLRSEIDAEFISYFLQSPDGQANLGTYTGGSVQQVINLGDLRTVNVPIPPLPEQQQIVGILDEAFEGIATAKINAEKNLQNASALFASHLHSIFSQRGEGWVEKTFEDICHKITDGTHHSPKKQFSKPGPGRFPYITSKNIRNNHMNLSNVAYIERAFHDEVYARCQPTLGDVLLTKDGANTGNVTLNTIDEPFSLLSSVCLIKTNPTVLRPDFLCFYLQSSTGLSSIVGQMTGAAIKRIVLRDIKKAVIAFPPLKEQGNIIETLNLLLSETQRLESIYQQKLAALEALKKSLLHQAFTGNL